MSPVPTIDYLRQLAAATASVDVEPLAERGLAGAELGKAIEAERIATARRLRDGWRVAGRGAPDTSR